jgi:uncharacterized membrane protein
LGLAVWGFRAALGFLRVSRCGGAGGATLVPCLGLVLGLVLRLVLGLGGGIGRAMSAQRGDHVGRDNRNWGVWEGKKSKLGDFSF